MHISLLDVDTRLQGSPRALILTPTRELCMQIEKQTKQLMLGQFGTTMQHLEYLGRPSTYFMIENLKLM